MTLIDPLPVIGGIVLFAFFIWRLSIALYNSADRHQTRKCQWKIKKDGVSETICGAPTFRRYNMVRQKIEKEDIADSSKIRPDSIFGKCYHSYIADVCTRHQHHIMLSKHSIKWFRLDKIIWRWIKDGNQFVDQSLVDKAETFESVNRLEEFKMEYDKKLNRFDRLKML